jgi:hypothetical protein
MRLENYRKCFTVLCFILWHNTEEFLGYKLSSFIDCKMPRTVCIRNSCQLEMTGRLHKSIWKQKGSVVNNRSPVVEKNNG